MIHGMLDTAALQRERNEWAARNFPDTEGTNSPLHSMVGMIEELGELAHAVLKDNQGIRGTHEEHRAAAEDALGDLFIYGLGITNHYDLDLGECIKKAWAEVRERDWQANPHDGTPVEEEEEIVDYDSSQPAGSPTIREMGRVSAGARNLDGPPCSNCGSIMQRTGSCFTCPSCGNDTGCG